MRYEIGFKNCGICNKEFKPLDKAIRLTEVVLQKWEDDKVFEGLGTIEEKPLGVICMDCNLYPKFPKNFLGNKLEEKEEEK